MRCPNCRADTLQECKVKDKDVKVDICAKCKGIWFDRGELEKVEVEASKELRPLKDGIVTNWICPRCPEPLVQFEYPQTYVKVHMCRRCNGLWLDAGELTEIRTVRRHLETAGALQEYAPVTGVKGALLRFIGSAIGEFTTYSD